MGAAQVRAGTRDDVAAVLALWQHAAENADRPADTADAVAGLVERDAEALLVAVLDGRVVGTVVAGWDGWRAHLYRLAVDPAHRRRGIGRLLLDAARARLLALGAIRLDAMVLDANHDARAVWEDAGYRPQDDWTRWVKPLRG